MNVDLMAGRQPAAVPASLPEAQPELQNEHREQLREGQPERHPEQYPEGHPERLPDQPEEHSSTCPASPDDVLQHFMGLMHLQRLLLHRAFAREEVHPAQAVCLRVLSHRGESTQSELAEAMILTRPSVTRVLQRMERAGLVWRRTDEADQRHTRVGLTESGRLLQRRLDTVLAEYMDATLARLPENDRRDLARILHRWRQLADEALSQNSTPCPPRGSAR
jgi:DNA-binding MarR family transcriptional regulator